MKKFRCIGCREYKCDKAFELCDDCVKDARKEEREFRKGFGVPKEV